MFRWIGNEQNCMFSAPLERRNFTRQFIFYKKKYMNEKKSRKGKGKKKEKDEVVCKLAKQNGRILR